MEISGYNMKKPAWIKLLPRHKYIDAHDTTLVISVNNDMIFALANTKYYYTQHIGKNFWQIGLGKEYLEICINRCKGEIKCYPDHYLEIVPHERS
jgi:hypothetical protein